MRVVAAAVLMIFAAAVLATTVASLGGYCLTSQGGDTRELRGALAAASGAAGVAGNTGGGPRVPVLVELFTSEGCSSCPPADDVLATLDTAQPVKGAEIIALGEHVDYWNHLGWTDPFSSARFSSRQRAYADRVAAGSVYTPQMIVDGGTGFVGSDRARAERTILEASRKPKPLAIDLAFLAASGESVRVRVVVRPANAAPFHGDVYLALTEDGLASTVARGENAHRELHHVAVVRYLESVAHYDAGLAPTLAIDRAIALDPAWKRGAMRAVAFVQETPAGPVWGAAGIPLPRAMAAPRPSPS